MSKFKIKPALKICIAFGSIFPCMASNAVGQAVAGSPSTEKSSAGVSTHQQRTLDIGDRQNSLRDDAKSSASVPTPTAKGSASHNNESADTLKPNAGALKEMGTQPGDSFIDETETTGMEGQGTNPR